MTKSAFKKLIETSRNYAVMLQKTSALLRNEIEEAFPDVELCEVDTNSFNAENLEQAIECYIQYGEYDIDSLWEELKGARRKE